MIRASAFITEFKFQHITFSLKKESVNTPSKQPGCLGIPPAHKIKLTVTQSRLTYLSESAHYRQYAKCVAAFSLSYSKQEQLVFL